MKTLNTNAKVRIKLTPYGIQKLKGRHEQLRFFAPSIGEFTPPETDKDGYCEMQLWDVMNTFGEDMLPGKELPFETEIQIDDSEFV